MGYGNKFICLNEFEDGCGWNYKMQRFLMNLNINPCRYLCVVRRPPAPVESTDEEPVPADIVIIDAEVPPEIIPIAVCDVEPGELFTRADMDAEFARGCARGYIKYRNEVIVMIIYLSICAVITGTGEAVLDYLYTR